MPTQTVRQRELLGSSLRHYRITKAIGAGGMGEVYLAHDEHLDRDVAIKVLPAGALADAEARRRFRNEALALSKLNYPAIETVYDFDTEGEIDFLVTEYIPGTTLSDTLRAGPLPEPKLVELATQLLEGLAAAHDEGIIHRDVKPANLRVTPDGRLKLLDFGLAIFVPQTGGDTSPATVVANSGGTLRYMSPEQLRNEPLDARTDIYSAGAVLYEMATGHPVFSETHAAGVVDAILHQLPLPPGRFKPDLPPRLEEVILRCLDKNRDHRYQSARDLLSDLRRVASSRRAETSVAVLYLENLGGQAEDEYFRDGITEDITTEISKIKDLRVFSRAAVLPYRDRQVTPYYVGQQLGATHVVEGSVRRAADRLRITTKLVDTKTGHAVWAERYDRQLQDVFAIQDEIARSVADALRVALSETERRAIEKVPTASVEAYDLYLRGRHFLHQFRRKGLDLARAMFERAIAVDPAYARAYAGLAYCFAFLYIYWESSNTLLEAAEAASRKALELDPDLAEAHTARGQTAALKKDYDNARIEFERAMRLDPRLFEPYYFYARSFYAQGKLEQAVQWFEQASRVLPEDYQSPMLMASALHGLSQREPAESAYRRGLTAAENHLQIHPDDARALYFGANALTQIGDRERALSWAERALQLEPDEHQVLYNVACVYALLGECEKAVDCLEKSVTRGWGQREWMEHDPDLASIRQHPRFRSLLASTL